MTHSTLTPERVQRVLISLGVICKWLAVRPMAQREVRTPPPQLSRQWVRSADDGTAEFRIAASLAGLGVSNPETVHSDQVVNEKDTVSIRYEVEEVQGRETSSARINIAPPMAAHFAPLSEKSFRNFGKYRSWSENASRTVVWGPGSLITNLIAVLERRLVEARIRGLEDKPLASGMFATTSDITTFLSGDFDDARCASILSGLIWAQPTQLRSRETHSRQDVPFAYAAIKPLFVQDKTLRRLGILPQTTRLPVPSGLIASLRAAGNAVDGRMTDIVVRMALARTHASGISSPFGPKHLGSRYVKSGNGNMGMGIQADRLAAALLIPVWDGTLKNMLKHIYPFTQENNNNAS